MDATRQLAWVIDGATDLGPPGLLGAEGGAAWIAATAHEAFGAIEEADMRATCRAAFHAIAARFEQDRTRAVQAAWELPKAAFAAARLSGNMLEVAWAADCAILQATSDRVWWCAGAPDNAVETAAAAALAAGRGADEPRDAELLADRRAHRGAADHEAISPDVMASERATKHGAWPVMAGDEILLMTDGFLRLVTDFHLHTAETLIEAVRVRGLAALAAELRDIERADAGCLRYPRFKASDDATALWLRVARVS
ncbi:MAG: protein phosphatase 2C domain-containing protein [Roseicyclus sp.]